jgi:cell wall-associated NlpC family hydrolase
MWALVARAAAWVFGDDVIKLVVSLVVGLFALAVLNTAGTISTILSQPWGSWQLAGMMGAKPSSQPVALDAQPQRQQPPAQVAQQVAERPAAVPVPVTRPAQLEEIIGSRAPIVIAAAMQYLGVPYLWGGNTKRGIDCSGLVVNALLAVGIQAPRVTTAQVRWTTPIPLSEVRAGDLVYFNNTCSDCGGNPTHVGIAIDNSTMVQAGGANVSVQSFRSGFYGAHLASAGRVPGL